MASNDLKLRDSLIIALLSYESEMNPQAVNYNKDGSIDRGVGQINSKTFNGDFEFFNPIVSVWLAMQKLKDCARQFSNLNIIRCYNWWGKNYVKKILETEKEIKN